jgi:hypothetical protein
MNSLNTFFKIVSHIGFADFIHIEVIWKSTNLVEFSEKRIKLIDSVGMDEFVPIV